MAAEKKELRVCRNGHRYYKSNVPITIGSPTCPVCKAARKPKQGFASLLSAPARPALENARIKTERQLSKFSEAEILKWHGREKPLYPCFVRH